MFSCDSLTLLIVIQWTRWGEDGLGSVKHRLGEPE